VRPWESSDPSINPVFSGCASDYRIICDLNKHIDGNWSPATAAVSSSYSSSATVGRLATVCRAP
jgi:hypothetical protein